MNITPNNKGKGRKVTSNVNNITNINTNILPINIPHNQNTLYKGKYLKIGTHNVRGFTEESKQDEMLDEYINNNIDIIGITETKINKKNSKNILKNKKNNKYKSWWTGLDKETKTGGVGILVKEGLDKHVTNITHKKGHLISVDMKFKGANTTRIINIYINCNDKEKSEREDLLNDLKDLITEG